MPLLMMQNDSGRTLATTTTMYRQENGRTYHAFRDGEYWQPNDAQQNNHEAILSVPSSPTPIIATPL